MLASNADSQRREDQVMRLLLTLAERAWRWVRRILPSLRAISCRQRGGPVRSHERRFWHPHQGTTPRPAGCEQRQALIQAQQPQPCPCKIPGSSKKRVLAARRAKTKQIQ
jgi:hypothetical protein